MTTQTLRQLRARLSAQLFGRSGDTLAEQNYRNLMLSGAWFGPVDGGIFNFLPVFLARLDAPAAIVSLLASGPSLLGILTFLPGGAYVERQRDLVRTLMRAVFLSRVFYPLIALAPLFAPAAHLPIVVVLLWMLASLPSAIHMPAFTAMMQRAIPVERRARFNGTRWGLMSLVSGSCIALFGFILDHTTFPTGYQIVFLASFGAALLNMSYFAKVRLEPSAHIPPARPVASAAGQGPGLAARLAQLRDFLRAFAAQGAFMRYNAASFAFRLALMMPAGLFSIYWVKGLAANDTWIGLRGTAGYAALVLGYWLWGRLANRIGHRSLLFVCGIAGAFYPALTALAPTVEWLLPVALLWGLTISGIDIGLFDMLLISAPAGRMPSFSALANVLNNIALAIGPLLGAGLAGLVGIRTALLIIGGLQLAATAGFLLLPNREQERATGH